MRVTIKSIARDLGISHMTVSRALSGSEHVSADTRKKICEYAEQVGYVRSSAASAMRGDPTAIVGLLLPNIVNDFYSRFANALSLLCAEAGFDLVIHLTGDDMKQERKCLMRLQALQARIVLLVPAPRHAGEAPYAAKGLELINLIRSVDDESCMGELMIQDEQAIRQAVSHLAGIGCRRIAYIGGGETLSSGRQRFQAFSRGLSENAIERHEQLVFTGDPDQEVGYRCALSLLDGGGEPDAVVCGGFELSNGALHACLERNVEMPGQLAFVGYGDPAFYQWIAGGVSTVSLSAHEVACRAIEMIGGSRSGRNDNHQRVPAKFLPRHSA